MSSSDAQPQRNWPHPYERPNQKWMCGRSESGIPCRLGPDQRGRCRTTAECAPLLELKPGEQKGHYRCTRPPEYGGPCAEGPLPTGVCSHSLPPCGPIRSWRSRRGIFTWWIIGLTFAALLLVLSGPLRFRFMNPGPVSTAHSQPRGGLKDAARIVGDENCGACHSSAVNGVRSWIEGAAGATPGVLNFASFAEHSSLALTAMDRSCSKCHPRHNFHHATGVSEKISCLSCHSEHEGDLGLHRRTASECSRCHGSQDYLNIHARTSGRSRSETNQSNEPLARLAGFVNTFSKDHPEFAVLESRLPDTNTLRFNHELHLSGAVVSADGTQLQCSSCHQPDAAGAYHRPINFERHCQSCHSLQFDPANPDLHLPHGQVQFVQAFLSSLPEQYERFGREAQQITERRALSAFVQSNMRRLQESQLGGDNLRQKVFFNRDRTTPATRVSTLPPGQVASFSGCAYCHEVSGSSAAPHVVVPTVPQRWLKRGSFHHISHQMVACQTCHNVRQSRQTADVLLPSVRTCASCHNPKSAPGESCILCHDYHAAQSKL